MKWRKCEERKSEKNRPASIVPERGPVLGKGKERFFVAELGALFFKKTVSGRARRTVQRPSSRSVDPSLGRAREREEPERDPVLEHYGMTVRGHSAG